MDIFYIEDGGCVMSLSFNMVKVLADKSKIELLYPFKSKCLYASYFIFHDRVKVSHMMVTHCLTLL